MMIPKVPFEDVFTDESGGNIKTPQSEYKSSGQFAVVDQGKALVAGYVDDEARLCGGGRSAIVFGDHTRCLKYVDFPFCMGADGVKVLRPKVDANLKYLYYYLKQIKIPDAGYDRHYKYLKRTDVLLPPLTEQIRIAAILDQADALRVKRREALAQLDSLTQAMFIDMFGDPVTNPKGFAVVPLQSVIYFQEGPGVRNWQFRTEGIKLLNVGNIVNGKLALGKTDRHLDPSEVEKKYKHFLLNEGDLVVASSGVTWGKIAEVEAHHLPLCLNTSVIRLRPLANSITNPYIRAFVESTTFRKQIARIITGSAQPNFGPAHLKQVQVMLPPIEMLNKFSLYVATLDRLKETNRASLTELDNLFISLQHRAFRGEL